MMVPDLFSIAPMLDRTDSHFRYLMRLISKKAWLYTEMITTKQLLDKKNNRWLTINPIEHPLVIQLGGSHPQQLAACSYLAKEAGFDEINLNVGCPSSRVQSGKIGACLMLEPELVAECVSSMLSAKLPVSVKCRLGVDHVDSDEALYHFIQTVAAAGCKKFIIHARKAWLQGLSPKENREIPPLEYARVYQLKAQFPSLGIILNGGIQHPSAYFEHAPPVDGIMLGRIAYSQPYSMAMVDQLLYGEGRGLTEKEVVIAYQDYIKEQLSKGARLQQMTRHLLGLFHDKPNARRWRQHLSLYAIQKDAGVEVITQALALLPELFGTGLKRPYFAIFEQKI